MHSLQCSKEMHQQMDAEMPSANIEETKQFQHGTAHNCMPVFFQKDLLQHFSDASTSSVLYQPPFAAHGSVPSPMMPFYMDCVHFQQPQLLALPNLMPMQTTAHYGPAFPSFPINNMGLTASATSGTFIDPAAMYFVQQV